MEERVFEYPKWFDGKKVDELAFTTRFLRNRSIAVHNGRFYGKDGLMEDELVKAMVAETLYAVFRDDLERRASTLLKSMRMFATQLGWKPDSNLIHVANGTLDVNTRLFQQEKKICQARLGVMFNPGAEEPRLWLDFLSQLLEAEDIPTLQEYMGYCLIPTTRAQKMLMLIGTGGEGKSRVGLVLKALLGSGCAYGSIHKVETNRFAPAALEGRLVMVDDDIDLAALPSTNTLKTIVTAEAPIDLERKGVQSHQGMLNCRFLCFGNGALSALHDSSDGFYRRQLILHTRPRPAGRKDDPFLLEKLTGELPGIFLWCLEGLKRLQDNDYAFTVSERAQRNMACVRRETDSILDFLHSSGYIHFDAQAGTTSKLLYRTYLHWCEDNACRPFSAARFVSNLREQSEHFGLTYSTNIPVGGGRRVRGFRGIGVEDAPFGG